MEGTIDSSILSCQLFRPVLKKNASDEPPHTIRYFHRGVQALRLLLLLIFDLRVRPSDL
jgi:hypothetical protein